MSEQTVKVTTPNPAFRGTRAGVVFVDGVAHCTPDEAAMLSRRFGYRVEHPKPQPVKQARRTRKDTNRGK